MGKISAASLRYWLLNLPIWKRRASQDMRHAEDVYDDEADGQDHRSEENSKPW
jgi:hypothetical protein